MSRATTTAALNRGVGEALRQTGLSVGFAGLIGQDRRSFVISALRGTRTGSLANLTVRAGEGVGGKTLAMGRPASVADYRSARGITRRYDGSVSPEELVSVLSVPVGLPGREPLAVLYLAERTRTDFGTVLAQRLRPVVTALAHELHVEAEVARRTATPPDPGVAVGAAGAEPVLDPGLRAELGDLMATTTDPQVRERLARLLGTGAGAVEDGGRDRTAGPLTPRELDVVRGAADGCSNAEIARRLGLTEGTVKSYMKGAMAKLGAENRVRAGLLARRHGLI
ncbi:response regulator transcription factor [Nocardioides zeae]|uniref:Response regulator transcription factor n=1 Tax=Nocardioides imazamoxiresistens TaxID=3231893 RepID=A0ABU3PRS9_9ACTN|nr:response regulator transcription factor [Nocardioides zeae]MDT9591923.1 response regulator transcription factor [Nocardioides zeae]